MRWTREAGLIAILLAMTGTPALAHVSTINQFDDDVWNVWSLTPDIVIATMLIAAIYIAGIVRRGAHNRIGVWRPLAFVSGVGAVFVALATPLDYIAEHLFAVHQIQHLLLRMLAPMLIALAAPQAILMRGLPASVRRAVVTPIMSNVVIRGFFGWLSTPVPLTLLFIAALYVWEYPPYHDAALLDERIHYFMHVTMLVAGLLFWWRIFDHRGAPQGIGFGTRMMMLWIVMLSNIALGAYTTIKDELLYPAYGVVGRLFDVSALTDEKVGGFVIWMPSSMMCIVAMIIVIHLWGSHETLIDERRGFWPHAGPAIAVPTTSAELIIHAAPRNRILAVGFGAFSAAMFAAAIAIGVLNHLNSERLHHRLAHSPFEPHDISAGPNAG